MEPEENDIITIEGTEEETEGGWSEEISEAVGGFEEPQKAVDNSRKAPKGKALDKKLGHLDRLNVVYVDIDAIKTNTYNPNRQSEHDFELLKKSMLDDGFTQPILVNDGTRNPELKDTIVDGEHRWRAARAVGYSQVPVVYVPFTEEQMKISTLRHNRARGQEDMELTAQLLKELSEEGFDSTEIMDDLLMDDVEWNKLVADTSEPEIAAHVEAQLAELAGERYNPKAAPVSPTQPGFNSSTLKDILEGDATMSARARAVIREQEAQLEQAKAFEEQEIKKREMNVYRILMVFTGDEAALVQEVLGEDAPGGLLQICAYIKEFDLMPGIMEWARAGGYV